MIVFVHRALMELELYYGMEPELGYTWSALFISIAGVAIAISSTINELLSSRMLLHEAFSD